MPEKPDVVIVGGGIVGCLTAYYLGHHGLTTVVVERDAIASQSSGAAAGLLSPLAESAMPGPLADLCLHSLRLHRDLQGPLQEESGVNYHFAPIPILRPAFTEEEEASLRVQIAWQQKIGLRVRWLDADTLRQMSTWLPDSVRGAICSDEEAQVEAYSLTIAAIHAAERRGASVRPGEVVGLARRGSRARGVTLADGTVVEGGHVVLALGPWTRFAGAWVGVNIPVEPLRGQLIKLMSPGPLPDYAIFHNGCYVLPKRVGHLLVGTTEERAGFVREVTPEGRRHIMDAALRMAPVLERAQAVEASACLRPLSQDGLPIIGRVLGWDNVFIATGHGRKGVLLSVATARYLAQLIVTGQAEYDLSPFGLERFSR